MKEIIDKQGLNAGEYLEVVYSCEDVSSDGLGCDCSASDAHDKDEWTPKCANSPFQNLLLGVKDTLHVVCDNQTDANTHADCAFYSDSLLAGFPILLDCKTSQCVTDSSESLDLLMPETKNTVLHVVIAGFSVAVFAVVVHCIYSMYSSLQLMQEWRQRYVTAGEPQGEAVAPQFAMHEAGELSPTSPTPASRSPGIRLGTRLLSYHIGYGSTAKTILNKVTLDVPEGQSLAIMGPSGAGKTTLLDILAAREKRGVLSGCVMINGEPVCGRKLTNLYRDIVGYVSQDDTLIPSLTVFESVLYSARLRLPAGMPDRVKKAKVDDVIASLGLTQCKDTKIGGPRERGISGGERRRVSIAMELVANPRVLFLDEPTSGLDSYNALIVMQTIARLKTSSCTTQFASFFDYQTAIVFSIHQPSKEIYDTFDNLLLLSKGHLLYCGSAAAAVDTCAALGYRAPDSISNPADFLLKMASTLSLDERSALSRAATARILSLSNSGHAGKREGVQSGSFGDSIVELMSEAGSFDEHTLMMDESIRRPIESRDANSRIQTRKGSIPAPLLEALENRKYYVNFYQELLIVGQRGYQSLMGSYYLVMCHIVVTMVLGGVLLLFYSRQPLGLSGIMNRSGCLTFTMLLLGFSSLSALELFLIERDVYDNPVYFLTFLYVLVLFNIITAGISFNAAMITPSFGGGVLFASLLMLTFFAFNPLIVQGDTLPESVAWLRFISPFFLSFEALMVNELHGQQCTFAPTTASGVGAGAAVQSISNPSDGAAMGKAALEWRVKLLEAQMQQIKEDLLNDDTAEDSNLKPKPKPKPKLKSKKKAQQQLFADTPTADDVMRGWNQSPRTTVLREVWYESPALSSHGKARGQAMEETAFTAPLQPPTAANAVVEPAGSREVQNMQSSSSHLTVSSIGEGTSDSASSEDTKDAARRTKRESSDKHGKRGKLDYGSQSSVHAHEMPSRSHSAGAAHRPVRIDVPVGGSSSPRSWSQRSSTNSPVVAASVLNARDSIVSSSSLPEARSSRHPRAGLQQDEAPTFIKWPPGFSDPSRDSPVSHRPSFGTIKSLPASPLTVTGRKTPPQFVVKSPHAARPKNGLRPLDLEANVIVLQRAMEEAFDRIAAHAGRPCIILYDRGILDVKAYMHDSEWAPLCSAVSLKEEHIMGRYDVVFHLVTAAKGAEGFYTNANNTARLESVEEARRLDDSTMQAWAPYAERRLLIDNSSDMQGKIRRIADHVMMRLQKASL
eukprot:gene5837-8939_t